MFSSSTLGALLGVMITISSIPNASSYTKYGRTCKDIGCRRDEVCVMAEDPCSIYQRDNCGRYPTCTKTHPGEANCASTVCGENEYCRTEDGVPKCVKKSTAIGYDSAGVSYVNGQRASTGDKTSNSASNSDPYANANAPPAPADPAGGYRQVNSDRNLGYPAYPSNTGSNSGQPSYPSNAGSSNNGYPPYPSNTGSNNGYPPYPSNTGTNNGYPPYPVNNRMPMPGYPANYPGQTNYPSQQHPGYQQPQYPGYPNYPQNRLNHNNVYSVYRKSNAVTQHASLMTVCLAGLIAIIVTRS